MKNTPIFLFIVFLFTGMVNTNAQYKQGEYQKHPLQKIFPEQRFDSVAARHSLGQGTATVKGVAFTKPKNNLGFKAPLANRIFANHITVELFPYTPYFEEWYELKKKKENVKRNKIVYMDSIAYQYRLYCETNSRGEFTFPKMKPGKYIIMGTLPWTSSGSYDQYTGSGYGSYGGRVDYYERQHYTVSHSDFLIRIIEVEPGEEVVKVKLK
ncbi:peptidase associated/transthyretin-like domain-containing protein [Sinomicrobium soli]|uniref:hypothetical protein n=1 Tax=Sinomicrobium sp. N-1-3-6 TaxID=2219864 RepID=UPI000DCF2EA8|nr:hypothetical protein [Sinomicrobium sp. N-1-3-6]RAV28696.1 hypothetical protein DN748_12135 [Sinomicrobium sp. N-1-3-6]